MRAYDLKTHAQKRSAQTADFYHLVLTVLRCYRRVRVDVTSPRFLRLLQPQRRIPPSEIAFFTHSIAASEYQLSLSGAPNEKQGCVL
jgi:hypothetical protein